MKYAKREKQIQALLIGSLLAYSPNLSAQALTAQVGTSLQNIKALSPDFMPIVRGTELSLTGSVPERCLAGATVNYNSGAGNSHQVQLNFTAPDCVPYKAQPEDSDTKVDLAGTVRIQLNSRVSGPVVLSYRAPGSIERPDLAKADALIGLDGAPLVIQGTDEIAQNELEGARQAAEARQQEQLSLLGQQQRELLSNLDVRCANGDYQGMVNLFTDASRAGWIQDLSASLIKMNSSYEASFSGKLADAETAEEAKEVLESFLVAAAQYGWDEDKLNDQYVNKRFDLLNNSLEDFNAGDLKAAEFYSQIDSWHKELRSLDRRLYRENKNDLVSLYSELASKMINDGEYEAAERYFDKAKVLAGAGSDEWKAIENALIEMYAEAYKTCVDGNPMKAATCESKFLKPAQRHAQAVGRELAEDARGNEEAAEAYQAFQADYIQTFGAGSALNIQSYGRHTPQAIGQFEQYKQTAMQTAWQQAMMQQQQQYMRSMQGGGMMSQGQQGFGMSGMFRSF